MMRLVSSICVLTAGALCALATSTKPSAKPAHKAGAPFCNMSQNGNPADVLTVFLTGNELGALKPCGCSGGQLGGLDRRSAVFNSVCAQRRLIVDTGLFVEGDGEQDLIKFNIIVQAFSLLGYDLVNLTQKDIEIAKNLGLLDSIGSVLNVISSMSITDVNVPAGFTKKFLLNKEVVAVTVAALDVRSQMSDSVFCPLSSDLRSVDILILNTRDTAAIDKIAKMGIVDCIIVPAESDEPQIVGDPNEKPLVVSAGRFGKYVGRLQITSDETGDKLQFSFSAIPVTEDLPQEESLLELYKDYQQFVRQANLLEKQPRFVLPNGLEYTGSESCKLCHDYEYEKWGTKAHAHAYGTLEKVGSQYDPECVLCHVVGMEYESGFVSEERAGHLKNVGCENCHGPGSEHISTLGEAKTTEPRSDCTDCHTPETSGDYAGNERSFLEKIVHWREPKTGGNVK